MHTDTHFFKYPLFLPSAGSLINGYIYKHCVLKFLKLYFDRCFTKCILGYTSPKRYFMEKMIPYSPSCHQPLKTFHTHTHTHTHTLPFSPAFPKCTWTWQPLPFFFSPLLVIMYMLHHIGFSSKMHADSLHLCWHHSSLSHYYLLPAFSINLKHRSSVLCCYSPTHFSYSGLSDLSKIKLYRVFTF